MNFYLGHYCANDQSGNVIIEKDVFIGPNCTILSGVTIGEGSVVVAGSAVTRMSRQAFFSGLHLRLPGKITHPLTRGARLTKTNSVSDEKL
jgi:tetrahydrodipicolinate N-succinyltransferase